MPSEDSASEAMPNVTVDPSLSRKYAAYELDGDRTFKPLFAACQINPLIRRV